MTTRKLTKIAAVATVALLGVTMLAVGCPLWSVAQMGFFAAFLSWSI